MRLLRRVVGLGPVALASTASQLNSLLIAVVYARWAGAEPFGIYQMALASAAVAAIVALSGAGTAATRAAAQGRSSARALFRSRLPWSAAAAALMCAGSVVAAAIGRGSLAAAILVAAVTLPLYVGGDVYPAHLLGARRYRVYLAFQLAVQTLTAAAVVAAAVLEPHRPWLAVLALAGLTGALQLGGLATLPASGDAEEDLRYARRMTGVSVLAAVDVRLDILLAGALLGAREAGIVAVARILPSFAKNLWLVVAPAVFARMAALPRPDAVAFVGRHRPPFVTVMVGVCAAGAIAAPWLIPSVFGSEFRDAVLVAELLLAALAIHFTMYLDHVLLRAQGDLREEGTIYVVLSAVSLVALPPLILAFGVVGVGVEALLSALVYVAVVARLRRRPAVRLQAA